jgi:hypothetical protein
MWQKRRVWSLAWFEKWCKKEKLEYSGGLSYTRSQSFGGAFIVPNMVEFCGKKVTWDGKNRIKEDKTFWNWYDWMFEPLGDFITRKVHSLKWFERHFEKDDEGDFITHETSCSFTVGMQQFCGKEVTWDVNRNLIKDDNHTYIWEEFMFKIYTGEPKKEEPGLVGVTPTVMTRRVHTQEWFKNNCQYSGGSYRKVAPHPITNNCFLVDEMGHLYGTDVTWDSKTEHIVGNTCHWQDWMFEPLNWASAEKKSDRHICVDDAYWFIDADGIPTKSSWDNCTYDKGRLAIGNVFLSEQEATDYMRWLKIKNKVEVRDFKHSLVTYSSEDARFYNSYIKPVVLTDED